jgi:hypothetical protein
MVLMKKCGINGYMTIEASLIMPLVIGVYLFLIFSGFFLYSKCVLIQDTYLKCFRASVFTYWEEGFGEVSYGFLANKSATEARGYIRSRDDFSKYPFFVLTNEDISVYQMSLLGLDTYTQINVKGTSPTFVWSDYEINFTAKATAVDPIKHIRKTRREERNDAENTTD